jgi:hypothetical protein
MAGEVGGAAESSVREAIERIKGFSAQLFFCGGHGGFVEHGGAGAPMVKRGGPMDRVFVLRNSGELGGNSGLDIQYGGIDFATGPLEDVEADKVEGFDEAATFAFEANRDRDAVVLRGAINEIDLPLNTVLFSGSVESSRMLWRRASGRDFVDLPYTAVHREFELHPALRERFDLPEPIVAVSAWCKSEITQASLGDEGAAFVSQQHLGSLRVFFP